MSAGGLVRGVALLARGEARGLAHVAATPRSFVLSLLPLMLVSPAALLLSGLGLTLGDVLASACVVLAGPVLSHALARAWGREDRWLLFATAVNWCQWAVPVAALVLGMVLETATRLGLSARGAVGGLLLGIAAYAFWLQWFVARRALGLGAGRAAALTLLVNLGRLLLVRGLAELAARLA